MEKKQSNNREKKKKVVRKPNEKGTHKRDTSGLNQFKKGESGNLNGRPRKLVKSILDEMDKKGLERVTTEQVKGTFQLLFNCSQKELIAYVDDEDSPMILRIVAKEMLTKKGFEIIEKMLDRAHGKAQHTVEIKEHKKQIMIIGGQRIEFE